MITKILKTTALAVATAAVMLPQAAMADEIGDFVVQKIYDAALSGDMETAMGMVSDGIIFTSVPPIDHPIWAGQPSLVGKAALSEWWSFLASDNSRVQITELTVTGDRAEFLFEFYGGHFKSLGIDPALSDGVAILRDGKLEGLMTAFRPEVMDALAAAPN